MNSTILKFEYELRCADIETASDWLKLQVWNWIDWKDVRSNTTDSQRSVSSKIRTSSSLSLSLWSRLSMKDKVVTVMCCVSFANRLLDSMATNNCSKPFVLDLLRAELFLIHPGWWQNSLIHLWKVLYYPDRFRVWIINHSDMVL